MSEVICGEFPECVPKLRGDGFVLRAHGPGDLERIVEQCQDPLAQRFVPLPSPYTHSTAHDFFTGYVAGGWNRREHAEFAIADVSDTYLGSMSLKARDHDRYEIGYLLHPDARGRGLATAAARVALRWAFTELGAQVVLWRAVGGNEASLRVAQKLGFECTSLLPGWFYTQGEYVDEVGGTLTRARFEAQWGL